MAGKFTRKPSTTPPEKVTLLGMVMTRSGPPAAFVVGTWGSAALVSKLTVRRLSATDCSHRQRTTHSTRLQPLCVDLIRSLHSVERGGRKRSTRVRRKRGRTDGGDKGQA